jgi:excinuclease UvrABC helicase subunit UvrB
MRKTVLRAAGVVIGGCFLFVNAQSAQTPNGSMAGTANAGAFQESKTQIQSNYEELYKALPQDIQAQIKSAASTIENVRMMTPEESKIYVASESERAESFIKSTISQLPLADAVKTQVDDARAESCQQISERMNELKARRAARK